jgi:hypothetical protein
MVLSNRNLKRDLTMFPLTGSLSLAPAGAILALATASIPARADELAQNLGPVAPREPILWVGSKRIIAWEALVNFVLDGVNEIIRHCSCAHSRYINFFWQLLRQFVPCLARFS